MINSKISISTFTFFMYLATYFSLQKKSKITRALYARKKRVSLS